MYYKKKLTTNFNNFFKAPKIIGFQYFIVAFFWLILTTLLVTTVVLFTNEFTKFKQQLEKLIAQKKDNIKIGELEKFLIINMTSFSFFNLALNPNTHITIAELVAKKNEAALAYSYIFITAFLAIIAFCFYVLIIIKLYFRAAYEKRYHLQTKFHNDYPIYQTRIYLDFTTNLTIIFSFYVVLTSVVILIYGLVLVLISYFFWYVLKIKNEILIKHKWWKSTNFVLLSSSYLLVTSYNLLKMLFDKYFAVDIEIIIKLLFPIGTITVIITLLIRNMLNSKVNAILKAVKTIGDKVSAFRVFYYTDIKATLKDYTFVTQLPKIIKTKLEKNQISTQEAYNLMKVVNDAAIFIENNFSKEKERNYLLYRLFNEIDDVAEINEIIENKLKINKIKQQKLQ